MTHPLVGGSERYASLTSEETAALVLATSAKVRDLRAHEDVVREGDAPGTCGFVLDGVLCRYKLLPEGKRQITNFLLAGDWCDLTGFVLGRLDYSVGAINAARVAHLLLEMRQRLASIGRLNPDDGFDWPVTQTEMADATGMTAVHMNRVLQALRESGLIAYRGRTVVIRDEAALREVGQFDASYLTFTAPVRTTDAQRYDAQAGAPEAIAAG